MLDVTVLAHSNLAGVQIAPFWLLQLCVTEGLYIWFLQKESTSPPTLSATLAEEMVNHMMWVAQPTLYSDLCLIYSDQCNTIWRHEENLL